MRQIECAGVIAVCAPSNKLVVVRNIIGKITLPKGTIRIEAEETPYAAAIREVREETGLVAGVTVRVDTTELAVCERPGLSVENPDRPTSRKSIHFFRGLVGSEVKLRPAADDVREAMWASFDDLEQVLTWPEEYNFVIEHGRQLGLLV